MSKHNHYSICFNIFNDIFILKTKIHMIQKQSLLITTVYAYIFWFYFFLFSPQIVVDQIKKLKYLFCCMSSFCSFVASKCNDKDNKYTNNNNNKKIDNISVLSTKCRKNIFDMYIQFDSKKISNAIMLSQKVIQFHHFILLCRSEKRT